MPNGYTRRPKPRAESSSIRTRIRRCLKQLAGAKIHRAERLEAHALDRILVSALVARLERRVAFSLSVAERELAVSIGSDTLAGRVVQL